MKFGLDSEQWEKFFVNRATHDCVYNNPENQGAIGGQWTYMFTPTSLGVVCKIQCACGVDLDVTDYDNW